MTPRKASPKSWTALILLLCAAARAQIPRFDHVVFVIMENHAYTQVYGSSSAPYITSLAAKGALFTQSYALSHPSQPNYLQLFSGSNQGIVDDKVPSKLPFTAANLGAELLAKGVAYKAYSEDLPSVGFTGATSGKYARKHAPWVNWQGTGANGIPADTHRPLTDFPTDFTYLPTVSFVVPNLINDIHDGTVPQGDAWIKSHFDAYVKWAPAHNSLFILTFDEDDGNAQNRILTFFLGARVKQGSYAGRITHYNVLRTLEDMYGAAHAGAAASAQPIIDVWDAPSAVRLGPLRNLSVTQGGRFRADGALIPFGSQRAAEILFLPADADSPIFR